MRLRRLLLLLVLGCFAGLFEATLRTFLPWPVVDVRPVLPILVCFIILRQPESAYVFAVSSGAVLDLFSVGGMTLAFARFLIIALLIALVAETVLTNHSLYAAIALTLLSRAFDWLWLALAHTAVRFGGGAGSLFPHWQEIAWTLGLDACIITFAFLLNHFVFKRFVAFRLSRY